MSKLIYEVDVWTEGDVKEVMRDMESIAREKCTVKQVTFPHENEELRNLKDELRALKDESERTIEYLSKDRSRLQEKIDDEIRIHQTRIGVIDFGHRENNPRCSEKHYLTSRINKLKE